ncbi:MAG TPA: hypothetical protein VFU33_01700 [Gaiellaceae bacterium]|nr:hypothetical protein [Gaiellaceae bacterium]
MNAAKAGAIAALAWAAVEPLDRRVLRHDYSDVAVLGKAVTRSRGWPLAGLAMHAANGAVFGLAYERARRRGASAVTMALAEHTVLFPLGAIVDRRHPARGAKGVAPLWSKRAFAQATFRHLLFGALLGHLAD